jgi:tetratricopeptide (TPR) repeat protein
VFYEESDDAYTRARLLNCVASLEAMQGHFDESRAIVARARELAPPAMRYELDGYLLSTSSRTEYIVGNFRSAEEFARAGNTQLESQGLVRYMSSELTFLVDALTAQGKLEEAEVQLDRAAPMAAPDDADALLRQARSRGRIAFARGDVAAAEEHVRVALSHAEAAQAPDEHADTLIDLARILQAQNRDDEARQAAVEALQIAEDRENLVYAGKARELLAAPAPVAAAD